MKFFFLMTMFLSFFASAQDDAAEAEQGAASNYDPGSCQWVEDIPRRKPTFNLELLCHASTAQDSICMGYVVCDTKPDESGQKAKFVRMATCGSRTCGDADAVACVRAGGYSSRSPAEERANVSNRVKRKIESAISR